MAALFDPFCNRQRWSVRLPSPGRMLIGRALSWPAKGFSWELFHTDALGFWLQTRGTFPQKWGLTFKTWTELENSQRKKIPKSQRWRAEEGTVRYKLVKIEKTTPSLRIEMSNSASWNDVTTQKCSHFSIVLHQQFGNNNDRSKLEKDLAWIATAGSHLNTKPGDWRPTLYCLHTVHI